MKQTALFKCLGQGRVGYTRMFLFDALKRSFGSREIQGEWVSANHYLDSCVAPNKSGINRLAPHLPTSGDKGVHCPPHSKPVNRDCGPRWVVWMYQVQTNEIQTRQPHGAESHASSHMCQFIFTHPLTIQRRPHEPSQMAQPGKRRKPHLKTLSHKMT